MRYASDALRAGPVRGEVCPDISRHAWVLCLRSSTPVPQRAQDDEGWVGEDSFLQKSIESGDSVCRHQVQLAICGRPVTIFRSRVGADIAMA